jgi:hypothetical protein
MSEWIRNEIEKVARGLRNAKIEPDAFLFIEEEVGWTWDLPEILGIPVYHAPWMRSFHDGRGDSCPWCLIFKEEKANSPTLNSKFFDGYDE